MRWKKILEIMRDFKDIDVKAIAFCDGGVSLLCSYIEFLKL